MADLILLSELIQKLKDKDYYRVFAKTLLMTADPPCEIPPNDELVKEMFQFFIQNNQLPIIYNDTETSLDAIESEILRKAHEKTDSEDNLDITKETVRKHIWEREIYIKIQDLKRLYANKCIVFPKSLLSNKPQ